MNIRITVNGRELRAKKGDFLLDICEENGIRVPTLCSLAGFAPTGACRLCVVEIEGYDDLVPSCSFPVVDGIVVKTHSARVIRARKTIVELLLSSHPDDCMFCLRSSNCELQSLAVELSVNERKIRTRDIPRNIDNTSHALSHHSGKCILCGRCIRVCDSQLVSALEFVNRGSKMQVGTVGGEGLENSSCISCGQCIQVCPTGALQEQNEVEKLLSILQNPDFSVSVLLDPAVGPAISDSLGLRQTKDTSGLLNTALKTMGFQKVFSGAEAADISLVQTAEVWTDILKSKHPSWYMTSSCAAWTHYVEQIRPEWMKHLLPVHTPLMSFARLFQKQESGKIIYISSCLASKDEIYRSNRLDNGKPLVDLVLTSRELMQLLRLFGIQLESLQPSSPDRLVKGLPNTNHLSSVSGGYLEALYNLFSDLGRAEEKSETQKLRGPKSLKKAEFTIDKKAQSWIATSNIGEAVETITSVERGKGKFVLLEVMTCPSGCISGGGQINDDSTKPLKNRIKTIYDLNQGSRSLSKELYAKYVKLLETLDKVQFEFKEVYI